MAQFPVTAPALATDRFTTVYGVSQIELVNTVIPLGFVMPAVGDTVTVDITPLATATAIAFQQNDVVIASESLASGQLQRIAYFAVDAAPVADTLVLRALAKTDPESPLASAGDTFAANCELTGQTRLPDRPTGAERCEIVVSDSQTLTNAAANESDGAHTAALLITGGLFPVLRVGFKQPLGADVDLVERFGKAVNLYGSFEFESEDQMGKARMVCATTNRFAPKLEATFYGV